MLDPFSEKPSFLCGSALPNPSEQVELVRCHEQRLATLTQLCQTAAECSIATDPDRHLLILPENEVSVLEYEGGAWARLCFAIRLLRNQLPLLPLEKFGFPSNGDDSLDENRGELQRIGTGMEAWAFQDRLGSVYKFFLPREARWAGATFKFYRPEDEVLRAEATLESCYRALLEKLLLLNLIGGMPTEIAGISPEGVLIVKQALGRPLPPGTDVGPLLSTSSLIDCPSRLLRCDRAHPRLAFMGSAPWLVADLHERNIVYDEQGAPRIIDLVAAQIPPAFYENAPLLQKWVERVRHNPASEILDEAPDDDL